MLPTIFHFSRQLHFYQLWKCTLQGYCGFGKTFHGRGLNRSNEPYGNLARPNRLYDQPDAPIELSTSLEAAKQNPIASNAMYLDFNQEMQ
jgi:hypothetical protein